MTGFMKRVIGYAQLVAAAALMHCAGGDKLSGAGSETTNGIVMIGKLQNDDGSPARFTVVKLIRDDYDGVADSGSNVSFIDTTDSVGAFRFVRVDSGSYNVLARNDDAGTGALLLGVRVKKDDSLVMAPTGNLQKTGSIAIDFSGAADTAFEYLFIPGTDIYAFVNNNGLVTLDNVPAGSIPVVSYATKTGDVHVVRYDVRVNPEDTATIQNPDWKYSRGIFFNTSIGGAGVGKDVHDFPVLIRLTGSNFKFREAQPDGRDVRFAKGDNSFAPFEIERWDPVTELAVVWVDIDTLFGNSTAQTITMYWGNPQAAAASDAGAVFDTAAGFQGVWHFDETLVDSARDATANHFDGAAVRINAASITKGMIGGCREFDGAAGYITIPNTANGKLDFPQNGNYTVSAWVCLDTLDSASHVILSKGLFQYYLWFTYIYQNSPHWEFVEFEDKVGWKCATFPVTAKQWVLVSGVSNGTSQYLYVNGELSDTALILYPSTELRSTSDDFVIGCYLLNNTQGKKEGNSYFAGKIDEVRISSRSYSAEWIRLCYMNQRTDDKLVTFK